MATAPSPDLHDEDEGRLFKLAIALVAVIVLGLAAWWIYSGLDSRVGVKRPSVPNTQIDLLPPPPPPPPPPPQEETPPEKLDAPTPDPAPAAAEPAPDAPAPMSMDAPATAGSDAFGLKSGSGGGFGSPGGTGSCVGTKCGGGGGGLSDSFYRGYLSSALQSALRRKRVTRDRFSMTVNIWIDGSGSVSRTELVSGSGDGALDQKVLAALREVNALRPPDGGVRFPQRTVVRGATGF